MKKVFSKIIFLLLTLSLTILTGYLGYFTYIKYNAYKIAQNADTYLAYIQNNDILLQNLEQEQSNSTLYLGYNGKLDFSYIDRSREQTDSATKYNKEFLQKYPKFKSNLQYVRSRVDVISLDYQDIIFSYYQKELSDKLLNEIKQNTYKLSKGVPNLKKELYDYVDLVYYRNNTNKEKSFISYILTLSKKMNHEDLKAWESILEDKKIPTSFTDADITPRVAIAQGIIDGNYNIDTKKWLEIQDAKIDTILKKEEQLSKKLLSQMMNQEVYPTSTLYYAGLTFISLLFLLIIFRKFRDASEEEIVSNKQIVKKVYTSNMDTKFQKRATDIPLSTFEIVDNNYDGDDKTKFDFFNPQDEFARIIKLYQEKTENRKIPFDYRLDQYLIKRCVGDVEKIDKALLYLLKYLLKSSSKKNALLMQIESIAQTKLESAIRITVNQNNKQFTQDEIKKIHNSTKSKIYQETTQTIPLTKTKENLIEVAKLVSKIDGNFTIKNDEKNGMDFVITINLKRE